MKKKAKTSRKSWRESTVEREREFCVCTLEFKGSSDKEFAVHLRAAEPPIQANFALDNSRPVEVGL